MNAAVTAPAATETCTYCGTRPATVEAYGEPFCTKCLCTECDHAHPDTDICPAVEAEHYDEGR